MLRNPRLNPLLRPDEWEGMARLGRLRLATTLAGLAAVLLGVAAYFWFPVDLTRDLPPETVVQRAGLALLQAGHYRFQMDLSGHSPDYPFPGAVMEGEYQRSPAVLRLSGEVDSGESRVPLEYYLEDETLFIRHPVTQHWVFLTGAPVDELTSFYPENLAAPFVGGVKKVKELGRERLQTGWAVRYRLELDPSVMLPRQPELQSDLAEYELWVDTRTLQPARFSMSVVRKPAGDGEAAPAEGVRFTYQLSWQFSGLQPLAVPDSVKMSARDVGGEAPPVQP